MKHLFIILITMASYAGFAQPGSGQMLEFNGSSSYVTCGSINLTGNQITLQSWVYVDAFKTASPFITSIMGIEQTGNHAAIRLGDAGLAANKVQFILLFGSTHVKLNGNTSLEADRWYHIAATFDGSGMKIYINGILDASNNQSGIFTGNSTFELGRNYANSRIIDGFLDEPSIFSTALTQATIRDWMCRKITSNHPNYSSLTAYWPMDEGTGTSADDISGNGYDGTLTSNPGWEYSGAPIGDESKHVYASTYDFGIEFQSGDSMHYSHINGATQGAHIYRVDSIPYNTNAPSPLLYFDSTHYWGIFIMGNSSYDATYYYSGNSFIGSGDDCFVGMANRDDGYSSSWSNVGFGTVNYSSQFVSWTDSMTSENILGLSANGPHTFTYTPTSPTCNGDNDGALSVSVSGGETPYAYSWAAGGTGTSISSIGAGYHVLTVTDDNGCVSIDSAFLDEPDAITGTITAVDASCKLVSDGSLSVVAYGGSTTGYTFSWNDANNSTTTSVSNLGVGTYVVTITDDNGCIGTSTATISSVGPDPIPNLGPDTNICGNTTFGLTATVKNGPPTSYAWSSGETASIKIVSMSGSYALTVTNSAGCIGSDTIHIQYVTPIQVSVPSSGSGTGSYTINASAGFTNYFWNNSDTGQSITVVTSGIYSVTATDSNGCTTSDTIDVTIKAVGIDAIAEVDNIRVWPNPAVSNLSIESADDVIQRIELIDIAGRVVSESTVNEYQIDIAINSLDRGNYLVRVSTQRETVIHHIIIK